VVMTVFFPTRITERMFDDSFADDGDAAVGGSAATATTGSVLGKRTVATAATATNLSTLLADSSALSAPEMSASAADLMNSSSLSAVPVSVKEMERVGFSFPVCLFFLKRHVFRPSMRRARKTLTSSSGSIISRRVSLRWRRMRHGIGAQR